jgi:hypothetical protein
MKMNIYGQGADQLQGEMIGEGFCGFQEVALEGKMGLDLDGEEYRESVGGESITIGYSNILGDSARRDRRLRVGLVT